MTDLQAVADPGDDPCRRSNAQRRPACAPGPPRGALGLFFISPVDHRLPALHPDPDDRDPGVHVHQRHPPPRAAAAVRRPRQLRQPARRSADLGLPGGHPQVRRCCALPVARHRCRSRVALLLNSRHLKASGVFRILFFLPYVVPFVAGVLIWQSMLNPDSGWINEFLQLARHRRPAELAPGPDLDLPGPRPASASGASAAASSSTWPACAGIPSELYDAARIDGAGCLGDAAPRDPADDVAGHLLHAHPGHRRRAPVLPRAARPQQGHRRAGRRDRLPQPLHLQELLHLPEHVVRRDPRLAPVRRSPWWSRSSCSGRRGAGSTTRRSASAWPASTRPLPRPTPTAAAAASPLPAAATGVAPGGPLVRGHVHRGRASWPPSCRRSCARSSFSLKSPEQISAAESADLSGQPGHLHATRARTTPSTRCPSTARPATWRSSRRAATSSQFVDPANPTAGTHHVAGLVADARRRPGTFDPHWRELRQRVERARLPAAAVQHDRDRPDRDDRDPRLVHARGLRLRPLPVPGPEHAVHAGHRDDLPAAARSPSSRPTRSSRASAGSGRGCRCSCRRSSPTPTTCSCCASTS